MINPTLTTTSCLIPNCGRFYGTVIFEILDDNFFPAMGTNFFN